MSNIPVQLNNNNHITCKFSFIYIVYIVPVLFTGNHIHLASRHLETKSVGDRSCLLVVNWLLCSPQQQVTYLFIVNTLCTLKTHSTWED